MKLKLDIIRFNVGFEKHFDGDYTSEIPDWYIFDKLTGKHIIGMNQLDLWSGGHQLNRGFKYIVENIHNNDNSKLLCVICNYIQFSTNKNKAYKLFDIGFKNDTICYLNNLEHIIKSFFSIL